MTHLILNPNFNYKTCFLLLLLAILLVLRTREINLFIKLIDDQKTKHDHYTKRHPKSTYTYIIHMLKPYTYISNTIKLYPHDETVDHLLVTQKLILQLVNVQ